MDRDEEADLAELIALVEGDHEQGPPVTLLELGIPDRDGVSTPAPDDSSSLDEDTRQLARLVGRQRTYVVSQDEIPRGLVEYVRSITRTEWLADQVLDRAAPRILRRLRRDAPEGRRARWTKRWASSEQDRTRRWLARLRDDVVRVAHLGRVSSNDLYGKLPKSLEAWRPDETGTMVIDEPQNPNPSFGAPGYMEQTPPKLLRWVHETWLDRRVGFFGDDVGLDEVLKPRVWDLTAGSGTASDYYGRLLGCEVIATDLTVAAADVARADCREVGLIPQHRGVRGGALSRPSLVVTSPDIVLFDPPSPGTPSHSQIYGEGPRVDDLALLHREPWIFTVADVAVRAAKHLAEGGVISLLLRCGVRQHGKVDADPELLDDLKTVLGDHVAIAHEMPIRYRGVRNQTSLGTNRVPAVHLLLTRSS